MTGTNILILYFFYPIGFKIYVFVMVYVVNTTK